MTQHSTPSQPMSQVSADDAAAAVHALAERYQRGAQALDMEAFLELYAEDVVIFDASFAVPMTGRDAWRNAVKEWFGALDADQRNVAEIRELTVSGEGDVVAAHGLARYAMLEQDGSVMYEMTNRLSWIVRLGQDGEWRIAHEHTSVAIDMSTGTALFT